MNKFKYLICVLLLLCSMPLWAADTKVSDLPAVGGAPSGTDSLYIVSGGVSKKVTVTNLGAGMGAATATALAANGANCSAGSYPLGVDASGAVESCADATTEIDSAISTHTSNASAHHTATVDTNLSQEEVEDFAGALIGDGTGTHTGLTITYQDATGDIDFTVGNAQTATALAANGSNCAAGSYPLGVDASGAAETCTDATTEIDSAIATHAAVTATHGATGAVVGTTNTQTLTNKTINTASNTITVVEADISDLVHTTDTTLNLAGVETITGNWVNTANPWADNEVADDITLTNLSQVSDADSATQTLTNKTVDSFTNDIFADHIHAELRNETGSALAVGDAVYISGYSVGQSLPLVTIADASSSSTMPAVAILDQASLANNATGAFIEVGTVTNMDTSAWSVGDALYISETGTTGNTLTNVKPTGTALVQKCAIVLRSHATLGVIEVFGAGRSNDVPNIPDGDIWVGNASAVATAVTMSGDATISNTGVVTVANQLPLAGGTMTGALVADEQGVEFTESDDVVTCAAGDYWLRADLSETAIKKCQNGSETLMDTTGGTPATADISDVNVTQTELAELETIDTTTISANQWAAVGSMAETLTGTELSLLDGITTLSGSNTGDNDEVGTKTTGDLCTNDGSVVNCTINTIAELETALDATDITIASELATAVSNKPEHICVAFGDETTAITASTSVAKFTFRMPYAFTLTGIRGSLTVVSSSGSPVFDVHDGATTIMTTNKILIDANELTSTTAVTAPTLTDTALADDAAITVYVDTAGTGAAGPKICLIGHQ